MKKEIVESIFNTTLIIAVSTGLFYFLGYMYQVTFLNYLGLPVSAFMPSTQEVIAKGGHSTLKQLHVLLLSSAIVIVAYALSDHYKGIPRLARPWYKVLPRHLFQNPFWVLPLAILVCLTRVWKTSENVALEKASALLKRPVESIVRLVNGDTIEGHIVTYHDGLYAFLDVKAKKVIVVEKHAVASVTVNMNDK